MPGQGTQYTFSDAVTTKRTIADFISIIDPDDVPLLNYLGTNNQGKFQIVDFGNHKYAWLEDILRPRTATLAEAMDTTETAMDVASGHGVRFHVGDVWKFDETGEYILVTAHDGTDTVTTIVRAYGNVGGTEGTATGSVTTATTLTYLYSARREGAETSASVWTTPEEKYNYSTIMHHEIKVTRSEMLSPRYGITDKYTFELMKALGGSGGGNGRKGKAGFLMIDLNNLFYYGVKKQRTGASVSGSTGGFKSFVTTNVTNANGGSLTQNMIEDVVEACWLAGSRPTTLVCNYHQKQMISRMFAGSVQTERTERTGGVLIDRIEMEGATLDVLLDRRAPTGEVYIFDRDEIGFVTLDDWAIYPVAVTADLARHDQIIGEFGLVVRHDTAHGYIYGLAD